MRSSGIRTSLAWPSRTSARRDSESTVRLRPEDAADRVQREAQEDLDRRRERHRHDDDERKLAVDLLDDAERLDRELQRSEREGELERPRDLRVRDPQETTALHDAGVDRDTDPGRHREAGRMQVEDAEVAAAVGGQAQRLFDAEAFDR